VSDCTQIQSYILSICNYGAGCKFCAVVFLSIICFPFLFYNYATYVFDIFLFIFLICTFVFFILHILCFCIVLFIVSLFVYSCPFPIFVQVYRPLSPGENPMMLNKYHIYDVLVMGAGIQCVVLQYLIVILNTLNVLLAIVQVYADTCNHPQFSVLINLHSHTHTHTHTHKQHGHYLHYISIVVVQTDVTTSVHFKCH